MSRAERPGGYNCSDSGAMGGGRRSRQAEAEGRWGHLRCRVVGEGLAAPGLLRPAQKGPRPSRPSPTRAPPSPPRAAALPKRSLLARPQIRQNVKTPGFAAHRSNRADQTFT